MLLILFLNQVFFIIARNVELGLAAIDRLNELGLKANFHQLDIDDIESIRTFASYLKDKYGGLDVLVNNAGVAFHVRDLNYRISIKNFLTFSIDLIYFLDNE
jgi:NAD(P)-dependent dehydrogenase (short-subunit alcohol dehydrogenase family)